VRQQIAELPAFLGKAGTGGVHLLDHRRILLGRLVHMVDGGIDLREAHRLFLRRDRDRIHVAVDGLDELLDDAQPFAGLADQLDAFADRNRRVGDQRLDFLGGVSRALGELADFLGDDGKTLAGFTGTSRLDACIEGQKVGLRRPQPPSWRSAP